MLRTNAREHLAVYSLGSLANLLLTIPQYLAVNNALEIGFRPQGTTGSLISQYGPTTGLLLDSASGILVFQGITAVLIIGVSVTASSQKSWKWKYSLASIVVVSYLAYHLGGKFLNALGWIGVLEMNGVNVSSLYGDLFWFGLAATICFLLSTLFLRRSYGKLFAVRQPSYHTAQSPLTQTIVTTGTISQSC